jgi:hypothetical protein
MKKLFKLLLLLLLIPVINVKAIETSDYITTDENVSTGKNYDHSYMLVGDNIKSNAKINGILFSLGDDITLETENEYSFVFGNQVSLNSFKNDKDSFVFGNDVNLNMDSLIGRDLIIFGYNVKISGVVSQNVIIYADNVSFENSTIGKDVHINASTINFENNVSINGNLEYNENANVTGLDSINASNIEKFNQNKIHKATFLDNLKNLFYSYLALLAVGMILIRHYNIIIKRTNEFKVNGKQICKRGLIGLLALIIIPIVSILLLITQIGLPLGLISLAIYLIFIYMSILPVSYLLGKWFMEHVFKTKNNAYASLAYGVLIFKLISLIPYIGEDIYILAMIIGFGYIFKIIKADHTLLED